MVLGNQARRRHHVESTSSNSGPFVSKSILPASHPPPSYQQQTGKGTRGRVYSLYRKPNGWRLESSSPNRRGDKLVRKMLLVGGAVVCAVYGALFLRLNRLIQREQNSDKTAFLFHWKNYHHFLNRPPPQSEAAKHVLEYLSSEQYALDAIRRRAAERRKRTRPPPMRNPDLYEKISAPYHFKFLEEEKSLGPVVQEKVEGRRPATNDINLRCGIDAQNAFVANPSFYPDIHTINEDSVILITGILGRIGFHLALKLATQCNAQVLIGVDSIYPNDTKHKLQLLKKLSTLYSQLPMKDPFIVTLDGLNPNPRRHHYQHYHFENLFDRKTGEFDYASFAKPTHVVHLLSAEQDAYLTHDDTIGGDLPYASNGGLFGLRQSLLATEQLLHNLGHGGTISQQLHFTFVSDVDVLKLGDKRPIDHLQRQGSAKKSNDILFPCTKFMEEILLHSYAAKFKTDRSLIVLRFPTVYGPWGKAGSFDHDLAKKAIRHWHDKGTMYRDAESPTESILLQLARQFGQNQLERDILFVDDAVNALLSAMQYHDNNSDVSTFNILSGEKASISDMADVIESYMPISTNVKTKLRIDPVYDENGRYSPPPVTFNASKQLQWEPRIFLRTGVKKLLAWHLDELHPFGPPLHLSSHQYSTILSAKETGQAFRIREGDSLCHPGDEYCLRGHRIFPCASECSDPLSCTKSTFDKAAEVSQHVTQNCETVLYTDNLNENISSLSVVAPEIDDDSQVCALAFILKYSKLANDLIYETGEMEHYSYKFWKVILVGPDDDHVSTELQYLLKMSPSRFFHSSVKSALYIPEDFSTNPELEDIIFTAGLLHRKKKTVENFSARFAYAMDKMNYKVGSGERKALIVMPGALAKDQEKDQKVDEVFSGSVPTTGNKIQLEKALKMKPPLIDQEEQGEWSPRRHIQFERGVASFFNGRDFVNPDVESPKFLHESWTRSHWVVHNFETDVSEEARNLRCEWYREQTQWGGENDSLSFAHIMARLEIERFNSLLDKDEKARIIENQRLNEVAMDTDEYEWVKLQNRDAESESTVYARIMDDRALIIERRLWKILDDIDSKLGD